jgi:hypothetical protein
VVPAIGYPCADSRGGLQEGLTRCLVVGIFGGWVALNVFVCAVLLLRRNSVSLQGEARVARSEAPT